MIMTMQDKLIYNNSTLCHICSEELGNDRVRDHCHLSGKFRGAAHEVCNLKYKIPKFSQLYFTICLAMIVTYPFTHVFRFCFFQSHRPLLSPTVFPTSPFIPHNKYSPSSTLRYTLIIVSCTVYPQGINAVQTPLV